MLHVALDLWSSQIRIYVAQAPLTHLPTTFDKSVLNLSYITLIMQIRDVFNGGTATHLLNSLFSFYL